MAVAAALLAPLVWLIVIVVLKRAGANPVETMTHETGEWALRILLLSLAVTPARILFKWRKPLIYRRMLGLFAFFYACVHFAIYLVFDQELDFSKTAEDVAKRPYITVGFAALVLLVPLAVTSTSKMMKRLGAKRWKRLHQLVYGIAVLGVVHYWWLVKADVTWPAVYAVIVVLLLGVRVYGNSRTQNRKANG